MSVKGLHSECAAVMGRDAALLSAATEDCPPQMGAEPPDPRMDPVAALG